MISSTTIELLEKWKVEYPQAFKQLSKSLDIVDQQLGSLEIPTDMLIEFHLCIVEGLVAQAQSDTKNGELEGIRFDKLNKMMKFNWSGKRYIKFNNDFVGQKPNCKCVDTDTFHKFKPDDICLIKEEHARHQNAIAC